MNLELNEIQRMIQDTARNFAQNELEPVAAQLDENPYSEENKKIFLGNLKKLAELGLMGINVSAEYGGSEAGVIERGHDGNRQSLRFHGSYHVGEQYGRRSNPGHW